MSYCDTVTFYRRGGVSGVHAVVYRFFIRHGYMQMRRSAFVRCLLFFRASRHSLTTPRVVCAPDVLCCTLRYLDGPLDGDAKCFDVIATLNEGCWVLFAGMAMHTVATYLVMKHACYEHGGLNTAHAS